MRRRSRIWFVVEAFGDAVGAEKEDVAGFVGDGADMGIDELVFGAEGFLKSIALGVVASFAFVEFAVALEPADVGVIVGELFDAAFAREGNRGGCRRCGRNTSSPGVNQQRVRVAPMPAHSS